MQSKCLIPLQYAKPAIVEHDVYIYDDIGGPDNYIELIQSLDNATETEIFNIKIATNGGDLDGCIALIHAIRRTKAQVVGHADSVVASAGTIIFLACHNWVVNEFAYFMFHDGSTMTAGKFNENRKQIEAVISLYGRIAEQIYKPFFSQEEIDKIFDGTDLYLTADEMVERIERVFPRQAQEDDATAESDEDGSYFIETI